MEGGVHEAFKAVVPYMDAQRLRTPRGLDWLKRVYKIKDTNALLVAMRAVFQMNATMWTEGVWEVVQATNSKTKFIISDGPMTFFNSQVFPLSPK